MHTTDAKIWSTRVANLAVDALVDNGLVKSEDFEKAVTIAATEIAVRLALRDYPAVED